MIDQPELFGPSMGGFTIHAWRDDGGSWVWSLRVRQDSPRYQRWLLVSQGEAESRYEAWADALVALGAVADLDDEAYF